MSEKQEQKGEKRILAEAPDTTASVNEVLKAVEIYRRSLDPIIPIMKAYQEQMSAQAVIIRGTIEMVRRVTVPPRRTARLADGHEPDQIPNGAVRCAYTCSKGHRKRRN